MHQAVSSSWNHDPASVKQERQKTILTAACCIFTVVRRRFPNVTAHMAGVSLGDRCLPVGIRLALRATKPRLDSNWAQPRRRNLDAPSNYWYGKSRAREMACVTSGSETKC